MQFGSEHGPNGPPYETPIELLDHVMLQQLYYSAVVKVEWSFDVCL